MFVFVGSFKNGVAEGKVDAALGISEAMRVLVHSDSDVWVLLSEVKTHAYHLIITFRKRPRLIGKGLS